MYLPQLPLPQKTSVGKKSDRGPSLGAYGLMSSGHRLEASQPRVVRGLKPALRVCRTSSVKLASSLLKFFRK